MSPQELEELEEVEGWVRMMAELEVGGRGGWAKRRVAGGGCVATHPPTPPSRTPSLPPPPPVVQTLEHDHLVNLALA